MLLCGLWGGSGVDLDRGQIWPETMTRMNEANEILVEAEMILAGSHKDPKSKARGYPTEKTHTR